MNTDVSFLFLFYFFALFLFYWVFGGVLFAVLTILRLGKIRKVRFSCLFTLSSLGCAFGATYTARLWSAQAIVRCAQEQKAFSEIIFSSTTCATASLFVSFLVWSGVLVLLGFLFLSLSKTNEQTWFDHLVEHVRPNDEDEEDILRP